MECPGINKYIQECITSWYISGVVCLTCSCECAALWYISKRCWLFVAHEWFCVLNRVSFGYCGRYTPADVLAVILSFCIVCVWVMTGHWLLMDGTLLVLSFLHGQLLFCSNLTKVKRLCKPFKISLKHCREAVCTLLLCAVSMWLAGRLWTQQTHLQCRQGFSSL